jgi:hypothetical protein
MASKLNGMSPEEAYFALGNLVAEQPDLAAGELSPEQKVWLRRAAALVQSSASLADAIQFRLAVENLNGILRDRHAKTIAGIVQRALAKAELEVPPEARGAFIAANNAFDVFAAVRKVLNTAEADVLLVDAQVDATVLTDYAVLAPETVAVRLLTSAAEPNGSLEAAARNWQQRFGDERPLAIRVADPETLQDQSIVVDNFTVWLLGASFSDLARDKRTTLMRLPPEATQEKIAAYVAIWEAAEPLQVE